MDIRFVGIDGLSGHEVNRIFHTMKDFPFIKNVDIRTFPGVNFHNTWGEVLNIYDVNITIEPGRDAISIHIFDDSVHIVDYDCKHEAFIYIDRTAYERLEII